MKKIFYFTNIFPHYRLKTWENLLKSETYELHFFYSKQRLSGIKGVTIDTHFKKRDLSRFHFLRNYSLKGIVFWQSKVIFKCLFSTFDTAVFLGEMTILSTLIAASVCRLRKKQVVFWGHGLYGNESLLKKRVRVAFYKLAHRHLLYENRAKTLMEKSGFHSKNLFVIYNSLNYDRQRELFNDLENKKVKNAVQPFFKNKELPTLIFTGRLTKQKKINLLIKAIGKDFFKTPQYNLLIVGEGNERQHLEELATQKMESGTFHFTGATYDETQLAKFLYYSDLCVSPGNVGLTAIHALNYGIPVCTHSNFNNQGPEAEAIIEDENGFLFEENNIESLMNGISRWFEKHHQRNPKEAIRKVVDEKYNPPYQLNVFKEAVS